MSAQLKLVHSSSPQKRELPIRGEIHRASQNWRDRNRRLTRRYSCIDNAIGWLTRWMYQNGKVGDMAVIYHSVTGLEIGTIKMTLKGRIVAKYIFDDYNHGGIK